MPMEFSSHPWTGSGVACSHVLFAGMVRQNKIKKANKRRFASKCPGLLASSSLGEEREATKREQTDGMGPAT